ncbi:MAG: hypothetical protein WCC06_06270 [Candidatus Aminicenantales bacterium]
MSMKSMEEVSVRGNCPVCEAFVSPEGTIEETEILYCPECQSVLVVDSLTGSHLVLSEAPLIEEDWGE